ncbi:MAG: branched-chain amino acid ABC transporter permease [Deltaproteobacteria bacterium]|nr:MAG: branched-chain amino acid ABC transporter permease [Deltaproteobacteria bacterium]
MITLQLLNGLVYGSLLIIMASGLVLIYGLRRVVNFAHGSLYMLGAYIGYSVSAYTNSQWLALLVVCFLMAIIGYLLDKFCFKILQDRDPIATVLVTYGLLLVFEDIVQTIWGKANYSLDAPEILRGSIELSGMPFPIYRLSIIIVGVLVTACLFLWLNKTRIGLFVRAASTDPLTTATQGVNTDWVSGSVVAIGAALAGIAGVVAAPFLSLAPTMGSDILVDSFVVVVIGGLGSFGGAFAAAMIVGQLQTFGAVYAQDVASLLPFLLMLVVLIWKPSGIAGSRV